VERFSVRHCTYLGTILLQVTMGGLESKLSDGMTTTGESEQLLNSSLLCES
jgi:hypothetical protein